MNNHTHIKGGATSNHTHMTATIPGPKSIGELEKKIRELVSWLNAVRQFTRG